MEELLGQAQMQNFVPVIDDRNVFIGIITRSEIIKYFIKKQIEVPHGNFLETAIFI